MKRFLSRRSFSSKPENGISRVAGPVTAPLSEECIYSYWNNVVSRYGDRPALVSRHERSPRGSDCLRWTFHEMDQQINRLARGLEAAGIKKGDRVGVYIPNNSQHAALQFATARIGAILTSLNPSYQMSELLPAINMVECKALFICPQFRTTDNVSALLNALPSLSSSSSKQNHLQDSAAPTLKSIFLVDNVGIEAFAKAKRKLPSLIGFDDLVNAGDKPTLNYELNNNDVVNMQFTSGTTGIPKAVALTHRNLLNNGIQIGSRMALGPKDVLCNNPPLFHCFGLVLGNLAAWTHGSCVVYPNESFDPARTLKAVFEEKCTALHGVPTMFLSMFEVLANLKRGVSVEGLKQEDVDFSSLRTGIGAGTSVPSSLMSKLINEMNLKELTIAYGMTETSPVSFQTQTHDPVVKRIETVGTIMPHVEAIVASPDDPSTPLPINTPGELFVAGYPIMHSYWHNPKETAKVVFEGPESKRWLSTGDLVSMDEDGFLSIKGRIKDVIIKGGENLFPIVLESHCLKHDGIADVAIVGVVDEFWGETVGAFVRRADNEAGKRLKPQDLRQYIKDFSLQSTPHWCWFLGEDGAPETYPVTGSGKIRKVALRDIAKQLIKNERNHNYVGPDKDYKRAARAIEA